MKFSLVFGCFSVVYLHLDQNFTRKSAFFMRFCFIFCPFLGELPCILGRLPFIFD
nr:MAG TPA: hypothetical protein [Caudoviricetes sp.]